MLKDVRLSALVIAHNEEDNIEACLSCLKFADEIVVVLDKCTDRTEKIAEKFADKIFQGDWAIEGERRNFGIDACGSEWILEVDCDERIPELLAQEIRESIALADSGYFAVPIDNFIGNTLVRYGWGAYFGVGSAPRLFSKGSKAWGMQRVHPTLELKNFQGVLKNRMMHFVDKDISDMIRRLDRYSTARALDLIEAGDVGTFRQNVRRIFSRFLKCYISRKGYKEGYYGFLIALCAGLYPILSFLKARLENDS